MALFGLIKTNQERLDAYVDPEYKDLLQEARERFEWALEADKEQRERELAVLKFCAPGGHWPEDIKNDRLDQGRPCIEVDRTNTFVRNVVNELRQMRPQPQVNPEGEGATAETAEIQQGMIRHIIYLSNGDAAVDTASEAMVRCGRGYVRVLAEYAGDDPFEQQDLVVRRVADPHSIVFDPTCEEADGSDANFAFVVSWVTKNEYRSMFPKSKLSDMGSKDWIALCDSVPGWADQDGVQVVEYYKRIREKKVMARLSDGSVLPKEDAKLIAESGMATIEEERESYRYKVLWYKINALEVLDQTVWPGRNIPIVPFYGNELVYEGKKIYYGLVEPMIGPQQHYDYMTSAEAEAIALAPKSPIIAPKGSLGTGAMRAVWNNINRRAVQVAEYEAYDGDKPLPPPMRLSTEANVGAITQAKAGAVDDLKATSGMFDANLGNREASQSGTAIRQLQKQGQVSNYHYQGNVARAVTYLGRILIDVTPYYYDTPRQVKIVRPDESVELAPINQETGKMGKDGKPLIYNTKGGRYGVTVSVGPSYQTKRQEDAAFMESLMQSPLGQVISQVCPDMPVRYLDSPAAKELAEILKKARPEQFQDKSEEEQPLPPEVQQQMEQMGQQMQEMDGMIQQLTESLKMAQTQIENKTLELESKERIATMQAQVELVKLHMQQEGQGNLSILQAELEQMNQRLAMLGQYRPIEETPESEPAEAAGFEPPEQPETAGVQTPGGQF